MDCYIDIGLQPDPEFPSSILMNALFAKMHRALVKQGDGLVGVSFPNHSNNVKHLTLGHCLRLHGTSDALEKLMSLNWVGSMQDHCTVAKIHVVPKDVTYRIVSRMQSHSNPERERRRLMARKGLSEEEVRRLILDSKARHLALPFVSLSSGRTGQKFRLFIQHGPLQPEASASEGLFSAYGLSQRATIPWF